MLEIRLWNSASLQLLVIAVSTNLINRVEILSSFRSRVSTYSIFIPFWCLADYIWFINHMANFTIQRRHKEIDRSAIVDDNVLSLIMSEVKLYIQWTDSSISNWNFLFWIEPTTKTMARLLFNNGASKWNTLSSSWIYNTTNFVMFSLFLKLSLTVVLSSFGWAT